MSDAVRAYLAERGCGEHIVAGGLTGLVEAWEQIVEAVMQGYHLDLDDYLNDMDTRQLLSEALALASHSQQEPLAMRVAAADHALQPLLTPATECLWGEEVAAAEGWTRAQNWWYFQYPNNAGAALLHEFIPES